VLPEPKYFRWFPPGRSVQVNRGLLICGFASVALYLWFQLPAASVLPKVLAAAFAVGSAILLMEQRSFVDSPAGTLVREGLFLGCFRVFSLRQGLDRFDAVITRRVSDWESMIPTRATVFVGLRRRSGQFTAVSWFYAPPGEPSADALSTARDLSIRTNLPFADEVPLAE
jgi:hypothetical protein